MIEALAVACLIVQLWLSEQATRAAARLLEETTAVRHLVLVDPSLAVQHVCAKAVEPKKSWCGVMIRVRTNAGWRSVCEESAPVVRGIDRYYAIEGHCEFPFPFDANRALRLHDVVRR